MSAPRGRLLYKLVEISAKEGNFQDAELFIKSTWMRPLRIRVNTY